MGNHCAKKTEALPTPPSLLTIAKSFPGLESLRLNALDVTVTREIARSELSSVWLGSYLGESVAVKRIATDAFYIPTLSHEIMTLSRLVHPHIVRFIGCTWTPHDDLSLVTEYMDGGDLLTFLKTCKADLSWQCEKIAIAIDVASGLAYLHAQHPKVVCHELRARNVLLSSDMVAKLSDIGRLRSSLAPTEMAMSFDNLRWTAPEVLMGECYSEQADVYSFGVMLADLDTRGSPYDGDNEAQSRSIDSNDTQTTDDNNESSIKVVKPYSVIPRPVLALDCPDTIRTIARACLELDPERRPSSAAVAHMLTDAHVALQAQE